jgi:hypothetical protein
VRKWVLDIEGAFKKLEVRFRNRLAVFTYEVTNLFDFFSIRAGFVWGESAVGVFIKLVIIEGSFSVFRMFNDSGVEIFVSGEGNEVLGGYKVVEKSLLVWQEIG